MKNKEKGTKKKEKGKFYQTPALGLIIAVLILLMVIFIRTSNESSLFPLGPSYNNLDLAKQITEDHYMGKDVFQNGLGEISLYHYLLASFLIVFPQNIALILLPIITGLLSAILFYLILRRFGIDKATASYSLIVLAITPIFITLFTTLRVESLIVLISLITFFVLIRFQENKSFNVVSEILGGLLLLLLGFVSLSALTITSLALLVVFLAKKHNIAPLIIPYVLTIFALLLGIISYPVAEKAKFFFHVFDFSKILSLLNASLGFDLFLLILFLIGVLLVWSTNYKRNLVPIISLLLIIISLFNTMARIYATFVMTYFCVKAINYFFRRKWSLDLVRKGTQILIICILLFSGLNQVNLLTKAQPDSSFLEVMNVLNNNSPGVVLSAEKNGFLVQYFSDKDVLFTEKSFSEQNYPYIKNLTTELYSSARLKEAKPILDELKIKYLLITPEMKEEIWDGKENGLLLVLEYSNDFDKLFESKGTVLWKYFSE